jgi:hypothetical protein
VRPGAVSPDRALCLQTFSHFLIVNKNFSLTHTLSLAPLSPTSLSSPLLHACWARRALTSAPGSLINVQRCCQRDRDGRISGRGFPPQRFSRRDADHTMPPHSPPLIPSVRMLGARARGAGVHCRK